MEMSEQTAPPEVATISQAAEYLGVPERTFYAWVKKGRVPVTDLSESRRVMTREQMQKVETVLSVGGRWAVLDGMAMP